jgi:hypothetical protein
MQVIDYIELYVAVTFAIAALTIVAEFIAIPLFDMARRMAPSATPGNVATLHNMPKPAARKSYKDWDNMQLDMAA